MAWLRTLLLLLCGVAAWAFAPVPAETWMINEKNGAPACGAVILEDRMAFTEFGWSHETRIRIYNEAGKKAGELGGTVERWRVSVKGQTVHADGSVVPFDDLKDVESSTVESNGYKSHLARLVPPGLTGDCVVDLRWEVDGRLRMESVAMWPILDRFPIRFKEITVPERFHLGAGVMGVDKLNFQTGVEHGVRYYRLRDLPAQEDIPYPWWLPNQRPMVVYFGLSNNLADLAGLPHLEFWGQIGRRWARSFLETRHLGGDYKNLLDEVAKDLPVEPAARSQAAAIRLERRVRNLATLTYGEKAELDTDKKELVRDTTYLGLAAARGCTTKEGMFLLYLQVFQDLGLKPVVVFVGGPDGQPFTPSVRSPGQFTWRLLGVPVQGGKGMLWFDPMARFFPQGLVPGVYQGVPGLLVDPETWSSSLYQMPVQPPALNRTRLDYALELGEEEDVFKVQAKFMGLPEYAERYRFLTLDPAEQGRKLRLDVETAATSLTVDRAAVANAADPASNLAWELSGTMAAAGGRVREVQPFPYLPTHFNLPKDWPTERDIPIRLPYCQILACTATFRVPGGYTLRKVEPMKNENAWGKVLLTVTSHPEAGGEQVEVAFSVTLARMFGAAGDYQTLRSFMDWVERGRHCRVYLDREP